ncbi:3-phosphoshikimate 1-carboxyvinyltransferase [Thermoanaerobacteraceae bacterium SP2]|nr:3-phosphoshikimate 1-carboxyvinyltransferase [Thermoanaerobacteraceae bacterium SP2]
MDITIKGSRSLRGQITVPGDKSISHRAIMLGAIAQGVTEIERFLMAEDCLATVDCFRKMGIDIRIIHENMSSTGKEIAGKSEVLDFNPENAKVKVFGKGLHGLKKPDCPLYVGNSGTTIRLLSGILAGQDFDVEITGDESIRRRPMGRVTEPLRLMGANIEGAEGGNKAPLKIRGGKLFAINYRLPVASAQVKSSLLLAGLYAKGQTTIEEPEKSRDHTEIMMKAFGVDISRENNTVRLNPVPELRPQKITIPGDISSAAFFMVGACILPDSDIIIKNVGINPTRTGIVDALRLMGADIEILNESITNGEPVADIRVRSSRLKGINVKGPIIPRIIDEIPILAVAAAFAEGVTVIKDAGELKVKESNRIAAMVDGLSRFGASITETEDGMVIEGGGKLKGGRVKSYGDHRIAMSQAITALGAEGSTIIENVDCVNISYPDFFKTLAKISVHGSSGPAIH